MQFKFERQVMVLSAQLSSRAVKLQLSSNREAGELGLRGTQILCEHHTLSYRPCQVCYRDSPLQFEDCHKRYQVGILESGDGDPSFGGGGLGT